MPTYEGLRLKLLEIRRRSFANYRKKKLVNTNLTIISNNCWGGMVYESYDLPKNSPTVGLFFIATDYIKFLEKLKEYISSKLNFISPEESRWKNLPWVSGDKRFGSYPIGVLTLDSGESIELFFLHYHSKNEAREKWERRCQRINWDKLIVKFNDQNGCSEGNIESFVNLTYENKLFFTCKKWPFENMYRSKIDGRYCVIKQFPRYDAIMASYEPFGKSKYIDINRIINTL